MDNYVSNMSNQVLFQAQAPHVRANGSGKKQTPEDVSRTAKSFEAMFIGQMLNLLFENVTADPLFGDKTASNIYRSMLLDQYGDKMAEGHSLGVADQIQSALLKLQEVAA